MDAKAWFYSLGRAVISGVGVAVTSFLGLSGAAALGANVTPLNFKALGMIALTSAVINLSAFLSKSPLPDMVEKNSVTITSETTKQP